MRRLLRISGKSRKRARRRGKRGRRRVEKGLKRGLEVVRPRIKRKQSKNKRILDPSLR
jgi:hypothetical protein